jgi:hypothetical protein
MQESETAGRKRVTITMDEEIHALGKGLAEKDRRDFSRFIETLIENEAVRTGVKPGEPGPGLPETVGGAR